MKRISCGQVRRWVTTTAMIAWAVYWQAGLPRSQGQTVKWDGGGSLPTLRVRLTGRDVQASPQNAGGNSETPPPGKGGTGGGGPGQAKTTPRELSPAEKAQMQRRAEAVQLNAEGLRCMERKDWGGAQDYFLKALGKEEHPNIKQNLLNALVAMGVEDKLKNEQANNQARQNIVAGLDALIEVLTKMQASVCYQRGLACDPTAARPDLTIPEAMVDASMVDLRYLRQSQERLRQDMVPESGKVPKVAPVKDKLTDPPPINNFPHLVDKPRWQVDEQKLGEYAFRAIMAAETHEAKVKGDEDALLGSWLFSSGSSPVKIGDAEAKELIDAQTKYLNYRHEQGRRVRDQSVKEYWRGCDELKAKGVLAKGADSPDGRAALESLSRTVAANLEVRLKVVDYTAFRTLGDEVSAVFEKHNRKKN